MLFDRLAFEADHVAVVARVKPHTGFNGEIESGLHKMMLIGLGKHKGATLYHQAIIHYSWDQHGPVHCPERSLKSAGVLLGLGIVENQYDQTASDRGRGAPGDFLRSVKRQLLLSGQAVDAAFAL